MRLILSIALVLLLTPAGAGAAEVNTSAGRVMVEAVVTGLDEPWSVGFLPDGGILVTERGGRLLHRRADGQVVSVRHGLRVKPEGQGGLMDVMVPRDFAGSREVFLSFATALASGSGTALAVGRLNPEGTALTGTRVIFQMSPGSRGGRHFGSRIVEARDGTLFLTIGERGDRPAAQDLSRHNGTIIRIRRDGTVPADNPFVGVADAQPEIWSYGHRNPQAAALDRGGQLWAVEHGARGGDEVNLIRRGANFGWPVIAYGRHYSGLPIGEGTHSTGMEQPEFYWDPSIAPSGMVVYSGKLWPVWRDAHFVGSLKFDYIARLAGRPLREVEKIQGADTKRVRDVREAPDGTIWFLSVDRGALYRMSPG